VSAAVAPSAPPVPSPTPLLSIAGFRRITPQQYHNLHHTGIIMEGEPVELLEGYMVEKKMRNPPHDSAIRRLTLLLPRHVPAGWLPQIQCAVSLGASEPEPDGAILRGDITTWDHRLPSADDFGIAIEVSDSTLAFDRRDKGRIYARAGIPVYWIVNVVDSCVEVYTDPDPPANPPAYRATATFAVGQSVPLVLDGVTVATIPVAEFLA